MNELLKPKIEEIKNNPETVVINFNGEDLSDDGAALLAEALQGRQITELHLNKCNITNEGFKALIPVINACTNLTKLDLSDQDLDLTPLTITSLESLVLSNCKIDLNKHPSIQSILSKNPNIKLINLDSNELAWRILNEIPKTKCTQLSIRNCNLNLEIAHALVPYWKKNSNQSFISVFEGNQFTETEWEDEVIWKTMQGKGLGSLQNSFTRAQRLIEQQDAKITKLETEMKEMKETFDQQLATQKQTFEQQLAAQKEAIDQQHAIEIATIKQENQLIIEQLNTKISLLEVKITEVEKNQIEMSAKIKTGAEFINEILFIGIKNGNPKLAELAINIGADLKAIDPESGKNALSLSLMLGHNEIADMLCNLKPEIIYYPNGDGLSTMEDALVDNSKIDQLRKLWRVVEKEAREKDYQKFYERSNTQSKLFLATDKLWESVKSGDLDGLKSVLDENEPNVDPNMFYSDNETLLYKVVYNNASNSVELARYLLSKGADYNLKSHSHPVPKVLSAEQSEQLNNSMEAVINMDSNMKDGDLLKDAAIINQYSNINAQSAYERACTQKNEPMIKLFSSHAVFNSIRNHDIAAMKNNLSIAEKYLTNTLTEFDFNNQTVLHLAALNPNPIFMETLLKTIMSKDESLEAKNAEGKTALHLAVEQQNEAVVKMLLDKGASIEAKDNLGQVPLHKAVKNYSTDNKSSMIIIENILQKHAECKIQVDDINDLDGKLPSDIAFDNKHSQLAVNIGSLYSKYRAKIKQNNLSHATCSSSLFNSSSQSNSQVENKLKDSNDLTRISYGSGRDS